MTGAGRARPTVVFIEAGRWQAFSDLAGALRRRGFRTVRITVRPRGLVGRVAALLERPLWTEVHALVSRDPDSVGAYVVDLAALAPLLAHDVVDVHVQDDLLPAVTGLDVACLAPERRVAAGVDPAVLADKLVQDRVARDAGVATPESWDTPETDRFPVVVKGRVGFGGKQVRIVHHDAELAEAWREVGELSGSRPFLQQHLPGRCNGAGVAVRGSLVTCATYDVAPPADDPTGAPASITMVHHPAALEATERYIRAIGYSGIFCINYVIGDDGMPRLIDFNPRVFGSWTMLQQLGVDVLGGYLAAIAGGPEPRASTARPGTSAEQLRIPAPPGDRRRWRRSSWRTIRAQEPFLGRRWAAVMRASVLAAAMLPRR